MISILLPVYNAAPFLPACLDSILAQSERDWELLAVDDRSEDDSALILQFYAQKDNRIRVFRNAGKGIIPALRLAFDHSVGQFVTRMDADDLMSPDKLRELRTFLESRGPGHLATGLVTYFSQGELKDGYLRYAAWLNELARNGRHYEDVYRECVIPSPCWMVYRQDLLRCEAFTPDRYPEDYDLCFRFYRAGLTPVSVPKVLHHWRDHPGRASRNDSHYADNRFFQIKIHYFLQVDRRPCRPLVLWGAGAKGKMVARLLLAQNEPFHWVCDNESKWGNQIYGIEMLPWTMIATWKNAQIILAVSAPAGRKEIEPQLKKWQLETKIHYFWFC